PLPRTAAKPGQSVLVSTGDKELAQLVEDHVTLVNTMTSVVLDEAGVLNKFGVRPDQFIDYLMLVGDSSDGIPGVPSVGPKTAAKWLSEFDSLEQIILQADNIKGKVGEKFRAHIPHFEMTRQLVTIKCDVELDVGLEALLLQPADEEALRRLYSELEFRSWLNELDTAAVNNPSANHATGWTAVQTTTAVVATPSVDTNLANLATQTELVLDQASLAQLLSVLTNAPQFAMDTETNSLDYHTARLVGLSFATQPGHAWYVPVAHDYDGAPTQLSVDMVLQALKPLLEDVNRPKILQHAKYDMHVLANHGVLLAGVSFDTMLASYVLDATATRHNLGDLISHYLGRESISFESIAGKGVKQVTFNKVALEQAAPYAAEDADMTLRLAQIFSKQLAQIPELQHLLTDLELPVQRVLQAMERHGTLIDPAKLRMQSLALSSRLLWLEKQAYELAGEEFNLNSPKQLGQILFDKLGIPAPKKTASGQYSTAENVLEQLEHPLPKLLLEHRSLAKLKSTSTDKLPEMIHPDTGRVHTSYHQAVAATGRLSSSDPNLQNIPIRSEEGRRIRQAFIAPEGQVLMAADYSQIELRIMAHLSHDEGLLKAFRAGEDVHKATAAEVLGIPLAEVSSEQRRAAKAVNFGLIYGMSAFGLAKQLGISRGEAQEYIARYFSRYPGVQSYMERTRQQAHEQGYVETLFGRRLMLRDIRAAKPMLRQAAERAAINAPMQGTAADIIKRAMIRVQKALAEQKLKAVMVMQVHDELVLEVPEAEVDIVTTLLKREMAAAAELSVPLVVDVGVGHNWDEAH
ncbi:MAG: DNA polymerase I, partial [Moraxellaceae bacterium]|nr:DNA polymerase I [Moraxellaceae bacterium]